EVDVAFRPRLEALDLLEDAHLGAVHLAEAVAPRLDLLRRERRLIGDEADLARHAMAGRAVELDRDATADAEVPDLGDRDVDLHVLVGRIEDGEDRRPGLGELAGPDHLRLHDGRHVRRADRVLGLRHLQLRELGAEEPPPALEDVELPARDGDVSALGLGPCEDLADAIERAARLVAPRARVVHELRGAGAARAEVALALPRPLGEIGGDLGLAELRPPRAHVAPPGVLDERDLLPLAADVGLGDLELLPLRLEPGANVVVVEAGEDGVRRDARAFLEEHVDDAPGHLAPDDPLHTLDEAGVVRRGAVATREPHADAERDDDERDDHDPSPHAHL